MPRLAKGERHDYFLARGTQRLVDEQVKRGYGTSSEYVRELIRKDQDRLRLRELLLAGAASQPTASADATYFKRLRSRVRAGRATGMQESDNQLRRRRAEFSNDAVLKLSTLAWRRDRD
jgi:antitoxin ParD1/3/4